MNNTHSELHTCYLHPALHPKMSNVVVRTVVNILNHIGLDNFDAIAFRGMSGALIAPAVCSLVRKPFILCRKQKTSHSPHFAEGWINYNRIVILDDIIETGETLQSIQDAIQDEIDDDESPEGRKDPKYVAVVLYNTVTDKLSWVGFFDKTPIPMYSFQISIPYNYSDSDKYDKYQDPFCPDELVYNISYGRNSRLLLRKDSSEFDVVTG